MEIGTTPSASSGAKPDALANLRDLHEAAEKVSIPFCLIDGTLLGIYRDGDLCPGDEDDIDIGVLDEDYWLVGVLCDELERRGFKDRDFFTFGSILHGVKIKRGKSHFDIVRVCNHPMNPECFNLGRVVRNRNGRNMCDVLAFVYPEHHHKSFGEIAFLGLMFRTPADPEGFLTARYGDWKTPIPRGQFNWYEQGHNSIRNSYPPIL